MSFKQESQVTDGHTFVASILEFFCDSPAEETRGTSDNDTHVDQKNGLNGLNENSTQGQGTVIYGRDA